MKKNTFILLTMFLAFSSALASFYSHANSQDIIHNLKTNEDQCHGIFGHTPFLKGKLAYDEAHQHIAQDTYLFAQMSQNAYEKNHFDFPENIKKLGHIKDEKTGFSALIFEQKNYFSKQKNIVVAYTGTQDWKDWLYGNALNHQYKQAEELIRSLKKKYPKHAIIATGHSLGGGLALHSSLAFESVPAYVFNPSYRTHVKDKHKSNERIVIAEKGDILKLQRMAWPNPSTVGEYETFYCAKEDDHSIYKLARCLTHIAAIEMEEAETSLVINRSKKCDNY